MVLTTTGGRILESYVFRAAVSENLSVSDVLGFRENSHFPMIFTRSRFTNLPRSILECVDLNTLCDPFLHTWLEIQARVCPSFPYY